MPTSIIRDQLIIGIKNDKVRERLLREENLILERGMHLCQLAEEADIQLRVIADRASDNADIIKSKDMKRYQNSLTSKNKNSKMENIISCRKCGQIHKPYTAYGKRCNNYKDINHFTRVCRVKGKSNIHAVEIV